MATPKIVIHGYYGAGNFGDDIILSSMIRSLRKIEPSADITVLSRDIVPVPESDSLCVVSRFDTAAVAAAIENTDLLICGGGGIFQDYSGFDLQSHFGPRVKGLDYYTVPIEMAYLLNKPIMLYAIGAGPLFQSASRRYLSTVLALADVITVRDPASATVITGINPNVLPVVTADPAVNYCAKPLPVNLPKDKPHAGLCLRTWYLSSDEKTAFVRCFADLADHLAQRYGFTPVLFPFNSGKGDHNLLKTVRDNMKHKYLSIVTENLSLQDTVSLARQLDLLIGMRLHSVVVGTTGFVPTLGIAYDEKLTHYLHALGLDHCIVSLDDVQKPQRMKEKTDDFVGSLPQLTARLEKTVPRLQETEKQNAVLAIELLRRTK